MSGVDVLAVLGDARLCLDMHDEYKIGTRIHEARAAVADLIEAVSEVYGAEASDLCANRSPDCVSCRIQRAVARCTGAQP